MSDIATPMMAGPLSSSGERDRLNTPAAATVAVSWAGRSRQGPDWPNADMEHITILGFRSRTASGPKPRRVMTPGRKASTRTSALLISSRRAAFPASDFKSRARLSLPRCVLRNMTVSPPSCQGNAAAERVGSGARGFSILMTRAPWSAIICVAAGPGRNRDRSRTVMPSSFMALAQLVIPSDCSVFRASASKPKRSPSTSAL